MLSRRSFINTALATTALATQGQAMAVGNRMIVDVQIHLWKAETPDWKWVPGRKPQLPEPFTIERALPLMDEGGVDRAVIVPPSWPGDRNDYAIEAATRYPNRFATMGRLPLEKPEESAARLPKWREQPGMKGIRLTFQNDMMALLTQGHTDWFWPLAEKHGLPVMFFAPGNIPKFAPVAERYPGLSMIVDHMSLNQEIAKEGRIREAIDEVVKLAKYPNVSVKISSAPNFSKEPYPWNDVTDALKRCFDAFGPRRCYWGTDITNSLAKATYRQRIEHFTKELSFMSEEDKDWVMGKAILATLKWS
jgi:predicted TIM-barrel fold metal-dependent hydrolase